MSRDEMPRDGNKYQWNPYAEAWDLVAADHQDLDILNEAAAQVRNTLDAYPGWVTEFFEKTLDLLDNAVIADD